MRPRPDDVPGEVVVGVAGAVWGLGLARLLAEAALQSVLYSSALIVAVVALGCAVVAVALWHFWPPVLGSLSAIPLALPALYTVGIVTGPLAGGVIVVGSGVLTVLVAMLTVWQDRHRWLLPPSLALVTLALDLRTLLPSIGEADTLEFQVVAAKLGVAHPTGYPLYVLLGKLFTWLPMNNVAWRVNLASAVFAAAAVVVLHGIVRRLTDRPLLSFLSVLAFAFSSTFWSQAVIAEVYTLHSLLVASILWLLLGERGSGDGPGIEEARRWQATFLLTGLSLTNHLTTVLLVPATGLALLWDRPRLRAKDWLAAGGLFLLGLSVYLFIPLRWPALNDGRWMTLRDFMSYVTGGQFHGALRLAAWQDPTRWRIVGRLMQEPFGWIGVGLAALGVVNLAKRGRRTLALTGVTFAAFLLYGLVYIVADIAVFLLPAHAVLAVWMASGATLLAGLLSSNLSSALPGRAEAIWRPGLAAMFALIPLSRIWINLPAIDRSRDRGSALWGRYVLSRPLAEKSAILADPTKFAPLYYLQQVEGVRTDLDMVLLGSEELYQADLRRRLAAGQTVYVARYLPHLEGLFLRSVGPLVEVRGEPSGAVQGTVCGGNPAPDTMLGRFAVGVQLLGADVDEDPLGRALYHVMLRWCAAAAVRDDLVVRLRLVDARGEVRWTSEGKRPVGGLYPTNTWPAEVPMSDYHEVRIPPWLPPGTYRLEVGLSAPFGDGSVLVDDDSTAWLTLQRLDVEPPSDSDPLSERRLCSFVEGTWLTGFDLPGEVMAGAPFGVDLAWRGVEEDKRVRFWWATSSAAGLLATERHADEAGSTVTKGMLRSRHTISAPSEAGTYALRVELGDEGGAVHRARSGWLAPPRRSCSLTEVRVLPGGEGLANYGERVLLVEADVAQGGATPGDAIQVSLRWRGLGSMGEDYTVFVHLVGPDGRLHGQADSWPVQGTYPTSQWEPGREVADPHQVRLERDAPAGLYRVEVGWYLLETMQRLQVVNEEGKAVADSFVVGTFSVQE
jgi:hypothetical protein